MNTNKKARFYVTKLNERGMTEQQTRYKYLIKSMPGFTSSKAFENDIDFEMWLDTFKLKLDENGIMETFDKGECYFLEGPIQSSFCIPRNLYDGIEEFKDVVYLDSGSATIECLKNKNNYLIIDSTLCNGDIQECKRFYIYDNETNELERVLTVLPYQAERKLVDESIYMFARSEGGKKIENNSPLFKYGNANILSTKGDPSKEEDSFKRVITIPRRLFDKLEEVGDIAYFTNIKELDFAYDIYKQNNYLAESIVTINGKDIEAKEFNFYIKTNDYITHTIVAVPEIDLYEAV